MLKGNRKYFVGTAAVFILLLVLELLAPEPVIWAPDYTSASKQPLGSSALRSLTEALFPSEQTSRQSIPAYNILEGKHFRNQNYIFINDNFSPDKLDTRELLRFVREGNQVFIAASDIQGPLADSLKIGIRRDFLPGFFMKDSAGTSKSSFTQSTINFTNPALRTRKGFRFEKGFADNVFEKVDSSGTTVLGINHRGKPNFIRYTSGAGSFYISALPETYANYLLTQDSCYKYAMASLSYLPYSSTFWDEYYKSGNINRDSPLRVIFSSPALRAAYLLLFFSALALMIIGIKRKQRIIPELDPMKNSTLEFVDVVGTLYFQTGDHRNIAHKNILYFNEFLVSRFQVKRDQPKETRITRIANLSGISPEKVTTLINFTEELSSKYSVSEQELLRLNKLLDEFYKNNKR